MALIIGTGITIGGGIAIGSTSLSAAVTWNPADMGNSITLSNGNLTATGIEGVSPTTVRATESKSTGKWVYEARINNFTWPQFGFAFPNAPVETFLSQNKSIGYQGYLIGDANIFTPYGVFTLSPNPAVGDWVMFAVDVDLGKIWMLANGQNINSGDPAGGTNPMTSWDRNSSWGGGGYTSIFPAASVGASSSSYIEANFGATAFVNPIPAGFSAWQTSSPPISNATWDPSNNFNGSTLSGDNLTQLTYTGYTAGGGGNGARGTLGKTTGKWYFEYTPTVNISSSQAMGVGITGNYSSSLSVFETSSQAFMWYFNGAGNISATYENGAYTPTGSYAITTSDIGGIAFDLDGLTIKYYKNGTLITTSSLPSGKTWYPISANGSTAGVSNGLTANFGATSLIYTPSGYNAGVYT